MENKKAAIVGAGITGLVTAYKLQEAGLDAELYEKNSAPGGTMKTVNADGWQVEYGPNTLLLKDRMVKDFLEDTGLANELITANPDAEKRFILKNGKLEPLPASFLGAIGTPLFSFKAKLRVLAEPFISKSNNPDQTVAEFVARRLGSEILDYAINPFVAGIFANNPDSLSLRHAFPIMHHLEQEYRSLITGSFSGAKKRKAEGRIPRELISFKGGIQQLPNVIASKLRSIHFNNEILSIEKRLEGWYLISENKQTGPFETVILNTPLHKWSSEFLSMDKEVLKSIRSVNYPPLSVLCLGFKKKDVAHPLDGFGFLVPEKENRSILGGLFSSTLFNNRAPEDHDLLTIFVGGGRQPKFASLETDKFLPMVLDELHDILGIKGEPVFIDHIYWPMSIPAYHVGYDDVLKTFDRIEIDNPGLFIAGNFRNGISVPDCIMNGIRLADRVLQN